MEPRMKNQEEVKGAVKAKSNAAKGLRELFEVGLKDIYWAEKVLTKTLPKMVKNTLMCQDKHGVIGGEIP